MTARTDEPLVREPTPEEIAAHRASLEARWKAGARNAKQLLEAGGAIAAPSGALTQMQTLLDWVAETVAAIRSAPAGTHSDRKMELAERCVRSAVQVRLLVGHRPPDAEAAAAYMEATWQLAGACASLEAAMRWERAVTGPSEDGSKGGKTKAARQRPGIEERDAEMAKRAAYLRAASYTQAEILDDLTKRFPGLKRSTVGRKIQGVKPSPLKIKSSIRKYLPHARRTSSP